jgi:type I restriction enzyme S subunit
MTNNQLKIDKLIQELCPGGVKSMGLSEVASIKRGRRVTKSELNPDGDYPVYSGGVTPMGYFGKCNQSSETITVVKYGTAGFVNFITEDFWANDVCYCVKPNTHLNNRYLFYVLKDKQAFIQSQVTDAIPAHLPTEVINNIQIPVPPIEVQKEIVDILDKFTQLEAELEARRKQYEFYRNQLLTFNNEGGGTMDNSRGGGNVL